MQYNPGYFYVNKKMGLIVMGQLTVGYTHQLLAAVIERDALPAPSMAEVSCAEAKSR